MMIAAYCIASLLFFAHPADDYYSSRNGKYLGSDGAITRDARLIAEETFSWVRNRFGNTVNEEATSMLNQNSQEITIDDEQIQNDLQGVRDRSMSGIENQVYIILDLRKARITSVPSAPGTNNGTYFEYYEAPGLGANMPVDKNQRRMTFTVILGAAHGHPDSQLPMLTTLPTMSPDYDAVVAHDRQVPIYGVDAMTNTGLPGSAGRIHRANPDGTIDNNIGWTKGIGKVGFDIARDALERWGRSGRPAMK